MDFSLVLKLVQRSSNTAKYASDILNIDQESPGYHLSFEVWHTCMPVSCIPLQCIQLYIKKGCQLYNTIYFKIVACVSIQFVNCPKAVLSNFVEHITVIVILCMWIFAEINIHLIVSDRMSSNGEDINSLRFVDAHFFASKPSYNNYLPLFSTMHRLVLFS